jgi:hypothetical protein
MNREKDRILIIIHGSKFWHLKNKFFKRIYTRIMNFFHCPKGMFFSDYKKFKKYMLPHYKKVILFKWSGGILRYYDLEKSAIELKKLLDKKSKYKIDIVAFSLGGFVLERSLEMIKNFKIKKIMFIGAVHKPSFNFDVEEIVHNIYSETDKLAMIANQIYGLALKKDLRIRHKKVKNLDLIDLNHDDLSKNIILDSSGKRLYDIYKTLLLE